MGVVARRREVRGRTEKERNLPFLNHRVKSLCTLGAVIVELRLQVALKGFEDDMRRGI